MKAIVYSTENVPRKDIREVEELLSINITLENTAWIPESIWNPYFQRLILIVTGKQ